MSDTTLTGPGRTPISAIPGPPISEPTSAAPLSTPTPTSVAAPLVTLAKDTAAAATDNRWKKVHENLPQLNRHFAAVYGRGEAAQINAPSLESILSDLRTTAEAAHKAQEWAVLDTLLTVLTFGFYLLFKNRNRKGSTGVEAKATRLAEDISRFMDGRADDIFESSHLTPITTPTTPELAGPAIARYLVDQQEIFRAPTTAIDGVLDTTDELRLVNSSGDVERWTPEFLERTGLSHSGLFTVTEQGHLLIARGANTADGLSSDVLHQIANSLVTLAGEGYDLKLSNPNGGDTRADFMLTHLFGRFNQAVLRMRAADQSHMFFDRKLENIPHFSPPTPFGAALVEMSSPDTSAERFEALNQALINSWNTERAAGFVSNTMSFNHYKLQFLSFTVPNITEDGLRWHDGDGHLNAAEWAFLYLKVNDLPKKRQTYYWCTIKWKDRAGKDQESSRLVPSAVNPATVESVKASLKSEGWATNRLTIEDISEIYSIPGQDELLPDLKGFSPGHLKALWTDETGTFRPPVNVSLSELSEPAGLKQAAGASAQAVSRWVMTTALTSWAENAGAPISDLLAPTVPNTQKVFLRQSNGAENADLQIGQTDVITSGNDTGAFGKCAPISYFSASICGIATTARDALATLEQSGDSDVRTSALRLRDLLTHVPMNEANRIAIKRQMQVLRTLSLHDPGTDGPLQDIEQLINSFVDRLVVQEDAQGPYLSMTFFIPDLSRDSYLRRIASRVQTGPMSIKLRPADIQEYIEHTNRADAYRGGRQHMMDFFKDPSSLNRLELMRNLGVGLIAAGVDKALKKAGKKSGLLYGPAAGTVASMIYNRPVRATHMDFAKPAGEAGSAKYDAAFSDRRKRLIAVLDSARDTGGAVAVSMGYNSDTGHVNFLQDWGTPTLGGVEVSSEALARTHMNFFENAASSSAWNNDRVNLWGINPLKMTDGLTQIQEQLQDGKNPAMAEAIGRLHDTATVAKKRLITIAETFTGDSGTDAVQKLWDNDNLWTTAIETSPDYRDLVRVAAAQSMEFFKANLVLDRSGKKNKDNIVLMPSNTERDDSLSDNPGDSERTSGGRAGSQVRGSANATDASYFVPVNALAGGWDNEDPEKSKRYAHYSDKTDFFVMLKSMTAMRPIPKRRT